MRQTRLDRTKPLLLAAGIAAAVAAPALAQPANDTCGTAIDVTPGTSIVGTTVDAGADGSAPCGGFEPIPDVYYDFVAPADGIYQFDTLGSTATGHVITLFDSCGGGFRILEGCAGGEGQQASIRHLMTAGSYISIAVANVDPAGQPFTFNVSGPLPGPENDECDAAFAVMEGVPFIGDSTGATTSMMFDEQTDCNSTRGDWAVGADDVFLSFTPSFTGFYDVSACGSNYNTVVSVHDGCPATPANSIACFDEAPVGSCSDEFGDGRSFLPGLELQGGVTYTIRVAGFADRDIDWSQNPPAIRGGQQGVYEILVTGSPQAFPNPPANDLCENAQPLANNDFVIGSNIYATGEVGPCIDEGMEWMGDPFDVWYSFTAPSPGENLYVFEVIADHFIAGPEMTLAAYESCGGEAFTCLASNFLLAPVPRRNAIALSEGETILLRVAALSGYQGTFLLDVIEAGPVASNATCETAIAVSAGSSTPVDTSNAPTGLPSGCSGANFDINALWYSFTAPQTAYYEIGAGIELDASTVISLFDACGLPASNCASGGFGAGTLTQRLDAGQTILIRVAPNSGGSGAFDLTVSDPIPVPEAPVNDECEGALVLDAFPFEQSVNFGGATSDLDTECNNESLAATGAGIWYTITPDQPYMITPSVSTVDPNWNTLRMTTFEGSCGALTETGCIRFGTLYPETITVEPGNTYYLLLHFVDTLNPGLVTGEVSFTAIPAPDNDLCQNAVEITEAQTNFTINISGATPDGTATCSGDIYASVWYTFTTGEAGDLRIRNSITQGARADGVMAVFTGSCGNFTEVACAENRGLFLPFTQYELNTSLDANTTYHLAIGSIDQASAIINSINFSYTGTIVDGCPADLDGNQAVDVFDLLAYLDLWFAADAGADLDGNEAVDVFDLLAYLDGWFAGC